MNGNKLFTREIYRDWMGDVQEGKIADILRRVKAKPKILDIGSGPGFLVKKLECVYEVDIDLENLKHAGGVKVLASGTCLPFKSGSFETVFCIDSIHLLKSADDIYRVLGYGGTAVVSTFCNEYNKKEKMSWLKGKMKNWKFEKEFFVGEEEIDAVVVCGKLKR